MHSGILNHKDTKDTKSRKILCVLCVFVVMFLPLEGRKVRSYWQGVLQIRLDKPV
jgi:hypothetical protein